MNDTTLVISVPRGNPALGMMELDLRDLHSAEARINEVAIVTKQSAPELLAFFTTTYKDTARLVAMLELELNHAKRHSKGIWSIVMLDRAPELLHKKGLSTEKNRAGSADLREAVLYGDPEYVAALEAQDQIEATLELIKSKLRAFDMAFSSVKKVLGEATGHEYRRNHDLSGGSESDMSVPVGSETFAGWGKPKY